MVLKKSLPVRLNQSENVAIMCKKIICVSKSDFLLANEAQFHTFYGKVHSKSHSVL